VNKFDSKMVRIKPAILGGDPVRQDYLIFGKPEIKDEEINEVASVLKSGWIGTGPKTQLFEKEFAEYIGVKHALALSSCTAGLHLALLVHGIGREDEVITTTFTFAATANAIHCAGAVPVFADINPFSFNISPESVKEKITRKTKAIIPVHFSGRPCDMRSLEEIAKENGIAIIEDAAHALGAEYGGRKIGNLGNLTSFSFYPNKTITSIKGGMLTTDDDELARQIKILSNQGLSSTAYERHRNDNAYEICVPGFEYSMTDVQAAVGLPQLKRLEYNLKKREKICMLYNDAFKGLPLDTPEIIGNNQMHSYHLYNILLHLDEMSISRDNFKQALEAENIGSGVHYIPLHLHKFYRDHYGYKKGDFPCAEHAGERILSLPLSHALGSDDIEDVVNGVTKIITYYQK